MIEEIAGATSEPPRRLHVLVLSAANAAVALVLLVSLVSPPRLGAAPQASAPAPSASAGPVMTIVSGQTMFLQSTPPSQLRVEVELVSECADGSRMDPPYYLVFEDNGQVIAVPRDTRTARSVPSTPVDGGSGWLTVSCATSNYFAPRIGRAR